MIREIASKMFKHIIIAIDGTKIADRALETGLALAKTLNAAATLVTVSEKWSMLEIAAQVRMHVDEPVEHYEELAAKIALKILSKAQGKAARHNMNVQALHVANRPVAEGIILTATAQNCDLIVMGSHGWRGLRRLILGSVTSEVLATAPIPVLVIR